MASLDIGIDMGSSNMISGNLSSGIVTREPSIIATKTLTDEIIGIGEEIGNLEGRERDTIGVFHPIESGVIRNYALTKELARYLFKEAGKSFVFKPRVIAGIPCGATGVEAQSMVDALMEAGARSVTLIKEPVAAAISLGIDIEKPVGNLIVDIGGGTTDAAVISMGGVVTSFSTRVAGNDIDKAIQRYMRDEHSLIIGKQTAEQIKKDVVSLWDKSSDVYTMVRGRGVLSGLPEKLPINRHSLFPVLEEIIFEIVECVQRTLDKTSPELVGDVSTNGIYLTGGSAYMAGIDKMLEESIGVKVNIPENPTDCVILGALQSFKYWGEDFNGFYIPHSYN